MFDTPYSRKIKSQVLNNDRQHIHNLDMINGEHSGFLNGGNFDTHICDGCGTTLKGGKNKFNSFMHGLKSIGNFLKPVIKPLLHAVTDKAIEGINSGGMEAMAGAGIWHLRGKYRTHKGDKDYHIDGHDVREPESPYTHLEKRKYIANRRKPLTQGAGIKEELIKDAKSLAKPILKTVANHYMDKGFNALEKKAFGGNMDPLKKRAMKNAQTVFELNGGKIEKPKAIKMSKRKSNIAQDELDETLHDEIPINEDKNKITKKIMNDQLDGGKVKKPSAWITHVKAFSKKYNISYRDALKSAQCKSSYKK